MYSKCYDSCRICAILQQLNGNKITAYCLMFEGNKKQELSYERKSYNESNETINPFMLTYYIRS